MEQFLKLYTAQKDYQQTLSGDSLHDSLMRGLREDPQRVEQCEDECAACLWDSEWIDAFEAAFPYIEKALEEQRRFIESFSEIRRVDQARKITVDSVRHLAEHSNMISRVQGEDIIPDKVLIVQREDNYAIYENRFLYTLVRQMEDFLRQRVDAVREVNGLRTLRVQFNRGAQANRLRVRAQLSCTLEQLPPSRPDAEEDSEDVTDTDRVERLVMRTHLLTSTQLMRLLKGCTPVSSPIVRTNVFKNNENFKQALNLFEFLQRYQKPGYEIVSGSEAPSLFPEELRDALCETLVAQTLSLHLEQDPDLKQGLEEAFALEQARRQLEHQHSDVYFQRELRSQVAQARREEITLRQAEIARREQIIAERDQRIAEQQTEIASQQAELTLRAEQLEQAQSEISQLRQTLEETRTTLERELAETRATAERELQETRTAAAKELADTKAEAERILAETKAEDQRVLTETREQARLELEQTKEADRQTLEAAQAEAQRQLKEAQESAANELRNTKVKAAQKLENTTTAFQQQLAETIVGHQEEMEQTTAAFQQQLAEASVQHQQEMEEAAASYARHLEEAQIHYDNDLEEVTATLQQQMEQTRTQAQEELSQVREDLQRQLEAVRTENANLAAALADARREAQEALSRLEEERRQHRETMEQAKAEALETKKKLTESQAMSHSSTQTALEAQREVRSLKEKNASLQKQLIQLRQSIKKSEEKASRRNLNQVAKKFWNG